MTAQSAPELHPEPYLVGVIDLLGQTDKLQELGAFSLDEKAHREHKTKLGRIAAEVQRVREKLDGSVFAREDYLLAAAMKESPSLVEKVGREQLLEKLGFKLYRNYFSDVFVLHARLSGNLMQTPRIVVLEDLAGAMFWSMAQGMPMRGGVEVGYAVEMPQRRDVYGYPALRAYQLESQLAQYPRVLIGRNLARHVEEWDVTKCGLKGRISREQARELSFSTWCRDFFCKDEDDGLVMLDFLGKGVRRRVDENAEPVFEKALSFVKSERDRFLKEGDAKHAARYSRLLRYFELRKSLWQ